MKLNSTIREALSFDDVLLVPAETQAKPDSVDTKTQITRDISLSIPLVSAGRDNVTESAMAIRMAQLGGIGIIHDNMNAGKQVEEVRRVKRAEGQMTHNPICVAPESSMAEAMDLLTSYKLSGLPVIEQGSQKVVGIITQRDVRFSEDYAKPVSELMTKEPVTAPQNISQDDAKRIMHEKRVNKLIIVDDTGRPVGLMTVKDIERLSMHPNASRDSNGMLRVAAAIGMGRDSFDRAQAMADAGVDVVVLDVAHAHTRDVIGIISRIRQQRSSNVQIVAGNVVTADAARSLIDAGADGVKVGIGALPESASRRLGIGMPQFTALLDVVERCEMMGIPVMIDGDLSSEAKIIKALAAGASTTVISDIFAGTEEAPGETFYHDARAYRILDPSARPQHRQKSSALASDPYYLEDHILDTSVPFRGPVDQIVRQIMSGMKMAMGYSGASTLKAFTDNAIFVRTK